MIVEQIWTGNDYRNFNYLIVCPETGEALAVDPLDTEKCLGLAQKNGWSIRYVLNTHEHHDHIGGNDVMIAETGSQLLAHANGKEKITGIDRGLGAGDIIKIGRTVELEVLDTPGHTMAHVCLLSHTDQPALFCGDTLFNAGAGHCKGGGHPEELYGTFANQLNSLSDQTRIYPGHDYIENNLRFTLDREPDNTAAKDLLATVDGQDTNNPLVSTIGLEREINTFFRLQSPSVIAEIQARFPDIGSAPNAKAVFLKLRELRNSW